jgi:hypothetical protein
LTCTVGLLSGIVEWDVVSLHYPQFHDPGIQYEPPEIASQGKFATEPVQGDGLWPPGELEIKTGIEACDIGHR